MLSVRLTEQGSRPRVWPRRRKAAQDAAAAVTIKEGTAQAHGEGRRRVTGLLPDARAIISTLTYILRKLVLEVFEMFFIRLVLIQDTLDMLVA